MMGGEVILLWLLNAAYEAGAVQLLNLRRAILRLGFNVELDR